MSTESEIVIRPANNEDCGRVQALVFSVLREYGLQPDRFGTDLDISDIDTHYNDRGGIFELIETPAGDLLGTVGLYPIDERTVELRKMYFHRGFRGQGHGRRTLDRMVSKARELGFKRLYLETATVLMEAVKLYENYGFIPTDEKHTPRCDVAYFLEL